MSELKPCPFCGGEADIFSDYERSHDEDGPMGVYYAACAKCGASGGMRVEAGESFRADASKTVAEQWNRRPPCAACAVKDEAIAFKDRVLRLLRDDVTVCPVEPCTKALAASGDGEPAVKSRKEGE